MTPENWPFADPPNLAVFTVRQIAVERQAILCVTHDIEDGSWQFLPGNSLSMKDAMLVCLKNVVAIDSTLQELADLPLGWQATRESLDSPWRREPIAANHLM